MSSEHDQLPFKFVGRVLVLVTLTFVVGGPFVYFYWMADDLPLGRYPLLLFAMPIFVVGALFFWAACIVLKAMGMGVFWDDPGKRVSPEEFTVTGAGEKKRPVEECQWCEEIVVPDEHERCPACKRPI